jgi:uncharacterized membrane protein
MQGLLETIQKWHIHPVVDHFTVAILIVAIVADLLASLFSTRLWLRYAALAMMIVGAAAAWGSQLSGGWEADRVWKAVKAAGGPAYATLHRHAEFGDYLPWVFLVLAIWRIGVQLFGFMAETRWLYLLVAVLAGIAILYQGYLGGQLVYEYGIGTALYNAAPPPPGVQPEATGAATPIPTVYVPSATATPESATPMPTASSGASATSEATPGAAASSPATPAATSAAPSPAALPGGAASPAPTASSAGRSESRVNL